MPVAPATAPDANAKSAGDQSGQTAQTVPLPPGAADVEARVVKAAPQFASQPTSVLAGLWHQAGEPGAPQTPQAAAAAQPAAQDTAGTAPAPQASAAKDAAPALAAATHDASAGQSVAATQADTDAAAGATVTPDAATAVPAAAAAAPTTATVSAAATPAAAGINPAVVLPSHVLPAYEQVAINLKQAAQSGTDRIEIQLKPASLGAIDVKLDVTHDGRITAVISADRSDTLNMLRQDSGRPAAGAARRRPAGRQRQPQLQSARRAQSFAQQSAPPAAAAATPAARRRKPASVAPTCRQPRSRRHAGALDIEV